MGVVWGSERDQQDRALLSLNVLRRNRLNTVLASDERLEYLHILRSAVTAVARTGIWLVGRQTLPWDYFRLAR
jgi:hypothetical protein